MFQLMIDDCNYFFQQYFVCHVLFYHLTAVHNCKFIITTPHQHHHHLYIILLNIAQTKKKISQMNETKS